MRVVAEGADAFGPWYALGQSGSQGSGQGSSQADSGTAQSCTDVGADPEAKAEADADSDSDSAAAAAAQLVLAEISARVLQCRGCGQPACLHCLGRRAYASPADGAPVVPGGVEQLQVAMGCEYTPRLLFERSRLLAQYPLYGFGEEAVSTAGATSGTGTGGDGSDSHATDGIDGDDDDGDSGHGGRHDLVSAGAGVGVGLLSSSAIAVDGALDTGALCPSLRIDWATAAAGAEGDCDNAGDDDHKQLGLGLFATADLAQGTFVGEYVGVVRSDSTVESGAAADPAALSYACFYASLFEPGLHVCAKHCGNVVRCINHSASPSLVNATFEQVVHRGMVRIACITKRSITAGEQLLVDYGAAYWKQAGVEPVQLATRAAPTAISPGETNPDLDQPGCANK